MDYKIKNSNYTLTVSTKGAEMVSLKAADGYEYIWQNEEGKYWSKHAPILFPVCGRLKDQSYMLGEKTYTISPHGFAKDSEFTVSELKDDSITLTLSDNETTKEAYPFSFTLDVTYELKENEVLFSVNVTNKSDKIMPYMFGWHPGFNLPKGEGRDIDDYRAKFCGTTVLDWYDIPDGTSISQTAKPYPLDNGEYRFSEKEIYKNDTMIFTGHNYGCCVYAPNHPFKIDMKWSDNLPLLCIWKSPYNEARFICIEPWSNLIGDGKTVENFDTRPMPRLNPGKNTRYEYSLVLER